MRWLGPIALLSLLGCGDKGPSGKAADSTPTAGAPTGTPTGTGSGSGTGTGTGTTSPCAAPPFAPHRGGDASDDARAGDPWFYEIAVPGLSDDHTTSGVAWVDLDRDGDPDALISRDNAVSYWRNDGCWALAETALDLGGAASDGLAGAMVADLNQDGHSDLFLPASGSAHASLLLISDGAWDRFVDRAADYGVANPGTYSRGGAAIGDLNGDGWLDLAVGGHQIGGGVALGRPLSHLYVFAPGPAGWSDGTYEDQSPAGFGGISPTPCAPGNEATGLETLLADLDGDGHLDLLWPSHNDMYGTTADDPCATGTNRYGLRAWLGDGTGALSEQPEAPGSVSDTGRMQWDQPSGTYLVDADGPAIGAETVALFDADNDGDRDLLAIAPTDPDWHVSSGQTTAGAPGELARYLRNDGGDFTEATAAADLTVLDQTLGQWAAFFDYPVPTVSSVMDTVCSTGPQLPLCAALSPADRQPYPGHVLPFDADNDGWIDLLYVVRQCSYNPSPDEDQIRSVLLHNRGDGTYEPLLTELSGVVGCGLAAFATDVDGDGWLDLHLMARDELQALDTLSDRVFWNRGATVHAGNHWVQVALSGVSEARAQGARVLARDGQGAIVATGWLERDTWRGSVEPVVHLGLGTQTAITLEVLLRDGTQTTATAQIDARMTIPVP